MKITTEYTDLDQISIIEVTSATYISNFVIRIDFSDKVSQFVDFKPFLNNSIHPSIRQYLDEDKFQQFAITDGNLNWNDYELIFPLEELYEGKIAC